MDQTLIKKLFIYKKGELFWRQNPRRKYLDISLPAGTLGKYNGVLRNRITIKKKKYLRSRLVFLFHKGYFPKEIDHINRNPLDDRIQNLRASSRSLNNINKTTFNALKAKYIYHKKDRDDYCFQKKGKIQKWFPTFIEAIVFRNRWLKKNDKHAFHELKKDKNERVSLCL